MRTGNWRRFRRSVSYLRNSSRTFPAFFLGIQIGLLIISHCVFPVLRRQVKKPVILSNHHISNLRIPKKAGIHIIIQTHQRIFEGKMILIKFLKGLWKFPKRRQTDLRKRRQFPVLIFCVLNLSEKSGEIAAGIAKVRDWLYRYGVETFHYYVAPNKETVYTQYMPDKPEIIGEGDSRMESFARYMAENSDVEFEYLYDYLDGYSEQYQLFRKYDTHMNNLGGYITSEKITRDLIGESLPIEKIVIEKGEKPCRGDLSRMIGRYEELDDDREYGLSDFHDGLHYKVKKEESEGGEETLKVFSSNSSNERTILVIGDSFRLRLEKFLPYRYQNAVFVRIDDFTPELLEEYKPDDVVVITVERDQRYMENLGEYICEK